MGVGDGWAGVAVGSGDGAGVAVGAGSGVAVGVGVGVAIGATVAVGAATGGCVDTGAIVGDGAAVRTERAVGVEVRSRKLARLESVEESEHAGPAISSRKRMPNGRQCPDFLFDKVSRLQRVVL